MIDTNGELRAGNAGTGDLDDPSLNGDVDVLLVREDIEEPADHGAQRKNEAEQADDPMCHHAGNQECEAERKHHRPGGRLRKENGAVMMLRAMMRLVLVYRVVLLHYAPPSLLKKGPLK